MACLAGEYSAVSTSACAQCAAGVGAAGTVDADSDPATACPPCAATEYSTAGLTACTDLFVFEKPSITFIIIANNWPIVTSSLVNLSTNPRTTTLKFSAIAKVAKVAISLLGCRNSIRV
jgi:hypothetical protein